MKVFITGDAGTGKSAVVSELQKRGYTAYSTEDLDDKTNYTIEVDTRRPVSRPRGFIDWSKYAQVWDDKKLRALLASDELVFIADLNSEQDDYYPLFDKIFVLCIDISTQKWRLLNRSTNPHDYGKDPQQLESHIENHEAMEGSLLAAPNAIRIDATQNIIKVVDEILRYVDAN